jgi:hypothetical protein
MTNDRWYADRDGPPHPDQVIKLKTPLAGPGEWSGTHRNSKPGYFYQLSI